MSDSRLRAAWGLCFFLTLQHTLRVGWKQGFGYNGKCSSLRMKGNPLAPNSAAFQFWLTRECFYQQELHLGGSGPKNCIHFSIFCSDSAARWYKANIKRSISVQWDFGRKSLQEVLFSYSLTSKSPINPRRLTSSALPRQTSLSGFCWDGRKVAHSFLTSVKIFWQVSSSWTMRPRSGQTQKINTWRSGQGGRAGKQPINPLRELVQRPFESFHCLSKKSWLYLKKRTSISRLQTLDRSFPQRHRGKTLDVLLPLSSEK